jgi:SAM-dependent methyltransferase
VSTPAPPDPDEPARAADDTLATVTAGVVEAFSPVRWRELHDQLVGEVALRHASGRRVLDIGHGAPAVTDWLARAAASLQVVDAAQLMGSSVGAGPSPAASAAETLTQAPRLPKIPAPDGAADLVVCLRTLPHLGRDDASARAGAAALLGEIARVLAPPGIALVEFENARSLHGLVHGIRDPMTVVGNRRLTWESRREITRFDTLQRVLRMLPASLEMVDLHGILVLVALPQTLALPLVGATLARVERTLRDWPLARTLGAQLIVVLRRLPLASAAT